LLLEVFASRLTASPDAYLIGAWEDDVLVGSIRFARFEAPNERHRGLIAGFYVESQFRRRGIARALLAELLAHARRDGELRRLELSVVTTQSAALSLYESAGFRKCGTLREAFAKNGQFFDESLMELSLI
jgi:RimJ/RimL family protein N-acetyltransferase